MKYWVVIGFAALVFLPQANADIILKHKRSIWDHDFSKRLSQSFDTTPAGKQNIKVKGSIDPVLAGMSSERFAEERHGTILRKAHSIYLEECDQSVHIRTNFFLLLTAQQKPSPAYAS